MRREKGGAGCFGPVLLACTELFHSSINQKYSPPIGVRLFIQFFVNSKHTRIRTIVHFYLGPLNGAWGNNIAEAVKPRQTLNLHE